MRRSTSIRVGYDYVITQGTCLLLPFYLGLKPSPFQCIRVSSVKVVNPVIVKYRFYLRLCHVIISSLQLPHPQYNPPTSRARSLRNLLVSGNECGRVFPAGVGPGSPSRDAANWLPSRFSLSVETRRRYGWLRMMVFPGARLFPSPNLVPFGRVVARERQGALSRRA